MNKILFILGALPLMIWAEILEEVVVQGDVDSEQSIKEESFYRTYTKETVTKEEIEAEGATDVKSALSSLPGVQVKETGSFSKTLSIRGLSGERVVSIVDGMKLANQGITHSGGGELGLVDISTVEKIELIKGSPSVIYDPGATGGVVKVTTLKDISKMEDGWGGKYTFTYDDGYFLKRHSGFLEGKYGGFYSALTFSTTNSDGRNVKDKEKQQEVIDRTNDREERTGDFLLTDLGYESDAYQFISSYTFNDHAKLYLKISNYEAEDITFTHGGPDSIVFHYDEYSRESMNIGVKSNDVLGLDNLDVNYDNQTITKVVQPNELVKNITELKSDTFKIDAKKYIDMYELLFGVEFTQDEAKTYTFSDQTYIAAYLNGVYNHENFTFTLGARYNHYEVKQEIEPGRNLDTIYDLVGVSGVLTDPINEGGLSYAAGVNYMLNDNNNLSLNYSKTYRYPSLYERFAFDTFIGGGGDLEAEKGDNYELSYKYLDDTFTATLTLFYTKFDSYIDVYKHVKIKNLDYLRECNRDPSCDPFDGGDNESEIFSTFLKYSNFDNVTNRGFELFIEKKFEEQDIELGFNMSLNEFTDAELLLEHAIEPLLITFDQDPLEFSAFVKKDFNIAYKPWVKLHVRHVTNEPTVEQEDGFEPFTLVNLYFGVKYKGFVLNAGIRNITDELYHEPYMGLDGVKRTFHMNLSASF